MITRLTFILATVGTGLIPVQGTDYRQSGQGSDLEQKIAALQSSVAAIHQDVESLRVAQEDLNKVRAECPIAPLDSRQPGFTRELLKLLTDRLLRLQAQQEENKSKYDYLTGQVRRGTAALQASRRAEAESANAVEATQIQQASARVVAAMATGLAPHFPGAQLPQVTWYNSQVAQAICEWNQRAEEVEKGVESMENLRQQTGQAAERMSKTEESMRETKAEIATLKAQLGEETGMVDPVPDIHTDSHTARHSAATVAPAPSSVSARVGAQQQMFPTLPPALDQDQPADTREGDGYGEEQQPWY
jgi:uncharacterized phage infection (PIP) family protein YhgE